MLPSSPSAQALALCVALLLPVINAQTFCNPLKNSSCPPDPALGGQETFDFTKGESDAFYNIGGGVPTYDANGVSFTAAKSGDSPTIVSKFYIMYGRVDTVMKVAPGSGIVSASVMMSDDADEIDWEALGADSDNIQTNYFSEGVAPPATGTPPSANPTVPGGTQTGFHTYTMIWTEDQMNWIIDGVSVVNRSTDTNKVIPSTPMALKIGIWAAGDPANNPNGPNGWAGATDWTQGPFTMVVQSVTVTDYSTGTQYSYGDTSGTWQSIVSTGGKINTEEVGTPAVVSFDGGSSSSSSSSSSTSTSSPLSSTTETGTATGTTSGVTASGTSGTDTATTAAATLPVVVTDANGSVSTSTLSTSLNGPVGNGTAYYNGTTPTTAGFPTGGTGAYAGGLGGALSLSVPTNVPLGGSIYQLPPHGPVGHVLGVSAIPQYTLGSIGTGSAIIVGPTNTSTTYVTPSPPAPQPPSTTNAVANPLSSIVNSSAPTGPSLAGLGGSPMGALWMAASPALLCVALWTFLL
ncbi:MAG: hypothetical protein M1838_005764 [Thelocarpon superellum]|nr:MAG: hypothetical protein M1838_005764 [Thelocarpon superellum]